MTIAKLRLESGEAALVASSAADLCTETVADEEFSLDQVRERANAIPQDVTSLMGRLRSRNERLSAVLLSCVDLTSLDAVATPTSFGQYGVPSLRALDALLLLFGVALGTPYCFATQQRGTLVLDVFPLRGREDDQLGCSSTTLLEWHNEDAFHPMRADFSMLMCIRNDQGAATRYAAAAELHLAAEVEQELRKPQFIILPDESHTYTYNLATSGVSAEAEHVFNDIDRMTTTFSPAPVLVGAPDDPLICVDFAYMPPNLHTSSANQALASLRRSIDRVGRSVVLKKGDIFIFDNRRGVHGRDAFTARYDGSDRWLKRLNVLTGVAAPSADGTGFRTLRIG